MSNEEEVEKYDGYYVYIRVYSDDPSFKPQVDSIWDNPVDCDNRMMEILFDAHNLGYYVGAVRVEKDQLPSYKDGNDPWRKKK